MENGTTAARLIERRRRHLFGAHAEHPAQLGRYKLALVSGAITLVCAAVAWSATEAPRGAVVLWSGDDQWVKIEQQDDPAAVPNDHPAQLGTEAITNALGALQVRLVDPDTGTESHRPVFTRDELGNLTPQVASGLAKAGPRQDVTFSTIGSHAFAPGGLLKDLGVNAGRVFYEDGRLNVIFGELQSNYRKKNVYGQRSEDFTPRRQGSRSKATQQKLILAARPGLEFHSTNDGDTRNDWVVIDTAVARSEVLAAPAPVPDASTAPAAAAESASKTGASDADLEQRLRKLKELKDKGLISEEAYRAKMQELLSEL
jgi:Short C-terminal domain